MSIAGLFLLIMLFAGVALAIAWPLLRAQGKDAPAEPENRTEPSALAQLQSQHEAILVAVRDLDFDYQTGKLTDEEYKAQRESLMQRGVEVLKQIDVQRSDLIERAVQRVRHSG
jgi:hypothetical protein